jgi:hypothetical protein
MARLCSASSGVDQCDALPPCVSLCCSLSPRQTPLRPSRPPSRLPAGHRGPNCSAAAVVTTTSTKAERASPTCCERRSTSSTATRKRQPKRRPDGPPGRVPDGGIVAVLSAAKRGCRKRPLMGWSGRAPAPPAIGWPGAPRQEHAVAATAQSATAVVGIDIGWSRVPPLSQGQLNVFLAQKDLSEPLMINEPEISL